MEANVCQEPKNRLGRMGKMCVEDFHVLMSLIVDLLRNCLPLREPLRKSADHLSVVISKLVESLGILQVMSAASCAALCWFSLAWLLVYSTAALSVVDAQQVTRTDADERISLVIRTFATFSFPCGLTALYCALQPNCYLRKLCDTGAVPKLNREQSVLLSRANGFRIEETARSDLVRSIVCPSRNASVVLIYRGALWLHKVLVSPSATFATMLAGKTLPVPALWCPRCSRILAHAVGKLDQRLDP